MSDFWLTPAAPGAIAPAHLERIRELHATVRRWIEASAAAQKDPHINANLPYADLMFAFGFATLGDHATANKLVEDARQVMEAPAPPQRDPEKEPDPLMVELVRRFLWKALKFRVEQAIVGKPHNGPLSAEIHAALGEINQIADHPPTNNLHQIASYIIARFREQYRLLEPTERIDVYNSWTKHSDLLKKQLNELHEVRQPDVLESRIRKLFRDGDPRRDLAEVQSEVLRETLFLSDRLNRSFVEELLEWLPNTLVFDLEDKSNEAFPKIRKQTEVFTRGLVLASGLGRSDLVTKFLGVLSSGTEAKTEQGWFAFTRAVVPDAVRTLRLLGLRQELERVLPVWENAVLQNTPLTEWRLRCQYRPEQWAAVLNAALKCASGWCYLGDAERAQPAFAEARAVLTHTESNLRSDHYTAVIRAFVEALGDKIPAGLESIKELVGVLQSARITNTFTTAQHFSRLHLYVVEDIVFAACRFCLRT